MAEVSDCHQEETPPPAHGVEANEIQLLLDKVKELEDSIEEREKLKADILHKIKEIRLKDADSKVCQTELILPHQITDPIIIVFVEALVKAHRYFDLKQYIRESRYCEELNNGQDNIFDIIAEKIEKENPFSSDEDEIAFAVQAVWREVNVEGVRNRRAVYEKSFNGCDLEHATDHYARATPILDLVYQIREKDYVIDEKPEVELQKIEKSYPKFYDDYFIYGQEPVEPWEYFGDTVGVKNVPIDTTPFHIDEALMDCGEVIGIREERGKNSRTGKNCKILFVAFEDSAAAKRALLKKSALVDGRPVEITTPESASAFLMPKEARTISSVESALEKYKELMNKYQKKRGVKRCHSVLAEPYEK